MFCSFLPCDLLTCVGCFAQMFVVLSDWCTWREAGEIRCVETLIPVVWHGLGRWGGGQWCQPLRADFRGAAYAFRRLAGCRSHIRWSAAPGPTSSVNRKQGCPWWRAGEWHACNTCLELPSSYFSNMHILPVITADTIRLRSQFIIKIFICTYFIILRVACRSYLNCCWSTYVLECGKDNTEQIYKVNCLILGKTNTLSSQLL